MTTTQRISDHAQTPNIWPKKPTCGVTDVVCGGIAPGTGVASVSFEKMSTRPNRMKFVARVPTNEGTFRNTVIRPLITPTPMHTKSEAAMAHPTGTPSVHNQYMTHGAKRKTCPAERSISPSTSTNTSPTARAPYGPAASAAELRPRLVRKSADLTVKKISNPMVMMVGVTSRCATNAFQRYRRRPPVGGPAGLPTGDGGPAELWGSAGLVTVSATFQATL